MADVKHTLGPWEVVKHQHIDGEPWLSVNQHADAQGMKEWIAEIKYLTTDPERQLANARLIAAAPDMYMALKAIEAWLSADDVSEAPMKPQYARMMKNWARAALPAVGAILAQIDGAMTPE